jgi:hypothetical protein
MNSLRRFFLVAFCLLPLSLAQAADISITAGSVVPSVNAKFKSGTAGATITAGQPVYLDTTTNTYKLADANGASPLYKVEGIAVNGASTNQPVLVCWQDPSFTLGGTVAAGTIVVASATAGSVAPAADVVTGWFTTVLGVGIGSNKINLNITRADVATP